MNCWRSALLLGCITISSSLAFSQVQPNLTNIIQADGTVKALYESQPVVTTEFYLFHNNWLSRVLEWETLGNGTTTFQRRGSYGIGIMTTSTQVSNSSNGTAITMTATPSQTVQSDSDHMGLMLDEGFWAGSTLTAGSTNFTFNPNFTQGFQGGGVTSSITVTRPDGFRLTITTPQPVSWSCQDSRRFRQGFEIRIGVKNGTWLANTARTYQATLKYSSGTTTTADSPIVVSQGSDWQPLEQATTVTSGSVLDWQDRFVPVAGSKGWLTVNSNGKFAFPGALSQPVKFYGANLAHHACFPSKNDAVRIADRLAQLGYNAVRLHHIDDILTGATQANSTTIDLERMDQINYLVSELKKRGIYISIDLHSNRTLRNNEILSGAVDKNNYKALLLTSQATRQNLLTYSSNLLNTLNPYTGLKWKDDPAIAWISLSNENSPFTFTSIRPDVMTMLDQAAGGTWNPHSEDGSKIAVNLSLQAATYIASQLRSMGVKALITDLNAGSERALSIARAHFDYVDNHYYFANISGYDLPATQSGSNPMRRIERIGQMAASRMKGKPYTISEFDAVSPNQFRAEFAIMMGAMGAVQQWDALWRFQFADDAPWALTIKPMRFFTVAADPLAMATERAIVAMFLRGDITSVDQPYNIANPLSTANHSEIREEDIVRQSVLTKPMAQVNAESSSGSGILYTGVGSSSNGQVSVDLNNLSLRISTPNTASIIGPEGYTGTTEAFSAKFTKSRASIFLTSVDKKPLSTSRRMLLAHLTDVQNSGATFSGKERSVMTDWGTLPHLVKVGTAEVTIKVKTPAQVRVYRLDLSGRRVAVVNVTKGSNTIKFNATTYDASSGKTAIYYEVTY